MAKAPDRAWLVPLTLRVQAPTARDARVKAIAALMTGERVPARWLTVGEPERAG